MASIEDILKSDAYRRMVEAVASGAIALVGAGSSARIGYPAWKELIERLAQEARQADPDNPNLNDLETTKDDLVTTRWPIVPTPPSVMVFEVPPNALAVGGPSTSGPQR